MARSRLLCALFFCLPIATQQATPSPQNAPSMPPNIPRTFTNLQVLPTGITQLQLVGIMKQMAITMGVRCSACHAVSDDLSEGSFASDEKPRKLEARKMLRLIQQTATPLQPQ